MKKMTKHKVAPKAQRLVEKGSQRGSSRLSYDIVIIGGGPVGLALAAALKSSDLKVCLVEKQNRKALAEPNFDGRDTALTHSSKRILEELAIFERLPAGAVSPIKEARVLNGTSPYALNFDSRDDGKEALGYLVSNHLIRKAAFETIQQQKNLEILTGVEVIAVEAGEFQSAATLSDGRILKTKLVVAADSRFSPSRQFMGVAVGSHDFGRTVVVCRVKHELPHDNIAHECFHYGRTVAVLPLSGNTSSIVITLPSSEVKNLCEMSSKEFSEDITERFENKLGKMTLITERHSYPLIATFADSFSAKRFALLGDAAVGMHP